MKLTNIIPNRATVEEDGVRLGHVERAGDCRWYSFDKNGEALGAGRGTRKSAAEFILHYYRELLAPHPYMRKVE